MSAQIRSFLFLIIVFTICKHRLDQYLHPARQGIRCVLALFCPDKLVCRRPWLKSAARHFFGRRLDFDGRRSHRQSGFLGAALCCFLFLWHRWLPIAFTQRAISCNWAAFALGVCGSRKGGNRALPCRGYIAWFFLARRQGYRPFVGGSCFGENARFFFGVLALPRLHRERAAQLELPTFCLHPARVLRHVSHHHRVCSLLPEVLQILEVFAIEADILLFVTHWWDRIVHAVLHSLAAFPLCGQWFGACQQLSVCEAVLCWPHTIHKLLGSGESSTWSPLNWYLAGSVSFFGWSFWPHCGASGPIKSFSSSCTAGHSILWQLGGQRRYSMTYNNNKCSQPVLLHCIVFPWNVWAAASQREARRSFQKPSICSLFFPILRL